MFATDSHKDPELTVSEGKKTKPGSLFFIWFAANLTVGDFALGFIPASEGLSFWYGFLAFLIGTVSGGVLLAMMSLIGSVVHRPQMALSRGPFGKAGSVTMSFLQWGNSLGWLSVNLILASLFIDSVLPSNLIIPIILAVSVIVFTLVYFGHESVRKIETVLSVILGILFAFITYLVISTGIPRILAPQTLTVPFFAAFGITLATSFSYIMAWGPYASDYSRFVYGKRAPVRSFSYTLLGGIISTFWVEVLGMMVALASGNPGGNAVSLMTSLLGGFRIIGVVALFLGGIAANAVNLYSNSRSIQTVFTKLKNIQALIPGLIISTILGIIGFSNFYGFYETFLLLLDYWITPWLGVLIAHYFICRYTYGERKVSIPAGMIAYLASLLISVLFMNPGVIYEGIFARYLQGLDISYFVSFFLAITFYVAMTGINRSEKGEKLSHSES